MSENNQAEELREALSPYQDKEIGLRSYVELVHKTSLQIKIPIKYIGLFTKRFRKKHYESIHYNPERNKEYFTILVWNTQTKKFIKRLNKVSEG